MTVFSSRIWCWECSQGKDKALIFSRASHLALSSVTTALHLVSDRGKTSVVWLTVVETSTHRAKIPHPCLSALNMVRRARWLVGFPAFHLRLTQLYFLNLHTREFTCRHWRWPIETNTCSDLPPQTRQFDRLVVSEVLDIWSEAVDESATHYIRNTLYPVNYIGRKLGVPNKHNTCTHKWTHWQINSSRRTIQTEIE